MRLLGPRLSGELGHESHLWAEKWRATHLRNFFSLYLCHARRWHISHQTFLSFWGPEEKTMTQRCKMIKQSVQGVFCFVLLSSGCKFLKPVYPVTLPRECLLLLMLSWGERKENGQRRNQLETLRQTGWTRKLLNPEANPYNRVLPLFLHGCSKLAQLISQRGRRTLWNQGKLELKLSFTWNHEFI